MHPVELALLLTCATLLAPAPAAGTAPASPYAGPAAAPPAGPAAAPDTLPAPAPGERGAAFPAPLSSPLEPRTRLAPVRVDRRDRGRWVGLVSLGDAFPFRLAGREPARGRAGQGPSAAGRDRSFRLLGEVAGGAFSRFDLGDNGNELVEVHFRVALRLRARWRGIDARLALYHVSSHLGDEFLERTGRAPVSTSREGLELLAAARPAPGLRLYGGPGLLVRSTAGLAPGTLRAGAEWRPDGPRWGPFRPYASAEVFAWEEVGWEPTVSAEAGLAFGGRYRLALLAGAGPTRAEQFLPADERLWGLSLSADF